MTKKWKAIGAGVVLFVLMAVGVAYAGDTLYRWKCKLCEKESEWREWYQGMPGAYGCTANKYKFHNWYVKDKATR
jgi:hypothetical protein